MAISFCSILPKIFSEDLDRKSLWERIGNGVVSAEKKSGGDFDEFINLSIEFVKGSPGRVASCEELETFMIGTMDRSDEWKKQFLKVIEKKYNLILVYARALYNDNKGVSK